MTLNEYKDKHGLTNDELAEKFKIHKGSVSYILNGRSPKFETIEKLVRFSDGEITFSDYSSLDASA